MVDDDEEICRLIELALSQGGLSIIEAHSGSEALETIRTQHPDVIVLDAVLPASMASTSSRLRGSSATARSRS